MLYFNLKYRSVPSGHHPSGQTVPPSIFFIEPLQNNLFIRVFLYFITLSPNGNCIPFILSRHIIDRQAYFQSIFFTKLLMLRHDGYDIDRSIKIQEVYRDNIGQGAIEKTGMCGSISPEYVL